MCHYARTDFRCGDWHWGEVRVRCPWKPHDGETCGAKLSDTDDMMFVDANCRLCEQVDVQRRVDRLAKRIVRWKREGAKLSASIARAEREMAMRKATVHQLQHQRPSILLSRKNYPTKKGQPERKGSPTKSPGGLAGPLTPSIRLSQQLLEPVRPIHH